MASAADDGPVTDAELAVFFQRLEASDGIILAVSGGPDSMALMHLFARWARQNPRFSNSLVVTVDHGLRPEAAAEADFVAHAANVLGLRHRTLKWTDEKPRADLQNAARTARYELLRTAAVDNAADTLVTAHTLDDQAETLLLALARGSGVYGLAGMPFERRLGNIRILRPLLPIRKVRLIATLRAAGIDWIDDPSNRNDRFRRVAMRQASPMLAGIGLTATTLAATATRLSRAATALDTYARRAIEAGVSVHPGGYLEIDLATLVSEPEEIALRALARLLRAMTGAAYVPRLERLERLWHDVKHAYSVGERLHRTLGGVTLHLPLVSTVNARPRLWLFAEAGRQGFAITELLPGQTAEWEGRVRISLSETASAPVRVQALGAGARRLLGRKAPLRVPSLALQTLASVWREEDLLAVPGLDVELASGAAGLLTATPLVAERLTGG